MELNKSSGFDQQTSPDSGILSIKKKNWVQKLPPLVSAIVLATLFLMAILMVKNGWVPGLNYYAQLNPPVTSVSNQAAISYKDSTNRTYSGVSNTVVIAIASAPQKYLKVKVQPENIKSNYSFSASFSIFNANTTVSPVVQSSSNTNSSGELSIDVSSLSTGSYDLKVIAPYCLSVVLKGINYTGASLDKSSTVLMPKAGNLQNADNVINSLDWQILSSKWGTSDAVADINQDGIVNTLDWSVMNKNWMAVGD